MMPVLKPKGHTVVSCSICEFARDKDGRWSIKIKKKPTSEALLKPLIKKLTDLLGG